MTAPEVRACIDGAAAGVPVAPRIADATVLYAIHPPVEASPMTCAPGTWTAAPALRYAFVDDATAGQALQSGPSAVFTPAATQRGAAIACVVHAANAGGTTTSWSGTAAVVQADLVQPTAVLRSARCRKRRCTVTLGAADPNSLGALRVRVTAERRVRARCGRRKRRARRRERPRSR